MSKLTFIRALEKYQCQGITPHSDDLFSIALKNNTLPSGQINLFQKKLSIGVTKINETIP